jgi:hypothetical protein
MMGAQITIIKENAAKMYANNHNVALLQLVLALFHRKDVRNGARMNVAKRDTAI